MEWVETTGPTIEEAKDSALDQLGVDEQEAEFEVLEEPQRGLFGRLRREARVRARVRPTVPRPKVERRDRKKRGGGGRDSGGRGRQRGGKESSGNEARSGGKGGGSRSAGKGSGRGNASSAGASNGNGNGNGNGQGGEGRGGGSRSSRGGRGRGERSEPASGGADGGAGTPPSTDAASNRSTGASRSGATGGKARHDTEEDTMSAVGIDEQQELGTEFLEGLLDAFGADGEVTSEQVDDDAVEFDVAGDDLGLLIGPKGATLAAVQDLMRTAVQRRGDGPNRVRLRLDIGGYRERRREALERFTRKIAEDVIASGEEKALEPMSAPDRKVVHDTINEIDGVRTISEGEDPARRVVILPE